jgi:hypothetical protein
MKEHEFHFRGMPVGYFKGPAYPKANGNYGYEPYQGPGHEEMREALAKDGAAKCYYDTSSGRLFFNVVRPSEGGALDLEGFGLVNLAESNPVEWLDPWVPAVPGMEKELEKEVGPGHVLFGKPCVVVARRIDNDDVLFRVSGPEVKYAVVRLTWAGKADADALIPKTVFFADMETWARERMSKDHEEYLGV